MSSHIHSTYRLQFHAGFTFADGAELAPYLAALGASHVYSSPILTARKGSTHGYDVVDHARVNEELGGEAGFRKMAAAFRARGVGVVLDIVPNHMAVGRGDNALWLDVLKHGRASRFASWFDIDFDCDDPLLRGKTHAPFLDAPLERALASGGVRLVDDPARGGYAAAHHDHIFPIRDEDTAEIASDGIDAYDDQAKMAALLARQNHCPDWWRNAADRVNWRRFFDITELAALRMEDDGAFESAHAVAFRLYAEGLIDGVRVDHVDGLADPAAYCAVLRARLDALRARRPEPLRAGAPWIVVEKILAHGERLPLGWGVDGSTGYDYMGEVGALLHDGAAADRLALRWSVIGRRSPYFDDEETRARRQILDHGFGGFRDQLVRVLARFARSRPRGCPVAEKPLRRALASLLSRMRAYRSYATGEPGSPPPGGFFDEAMRQARDDPFAELDALDVIGEAMRSAGGRDETRAEIARRFNQLASPLAAKAVEDTSFYRYGTLISRNEVGSDPGVFAIGPAEFHARMAERADHWPRSMLATATHDHKRGEDARARVAALSEIPDEWIAAADRWRALNAPIRPFSIDAGDEYLFFQTVVGAWPLGLDAGDSDALSEFASRLAGWRRKALREAKLRSGWLAPNERNEADWDAYVERMFDPGSSPAFLGAARDFVERLEPAGAMNSLSQLVLKLTCPGSPDFYQGTELWDFSLVDPDNRRPVDYGLRQKMLLDRAPPQDCVRDWRDGRVKLSIIADLLALRAASPELFLGGHEPVEAEGVGRGNVVAFHRRAGQRLLTVVVAVKCAAAAMRQGAAAPAADWWGDTRIALPVSSRGAWLWNKHAPTSGTVFLRDLLGPLPVAVLADGG